jgi:transposase
MEACSGAHHWARQFRQYGHTVKLIAPKFVTPYRMSGKRGKNDAADAAAICEAVTRPNMRFVPVKEEHQQIILTLHRTRQGFVEERTALYNRLRGLISEFGIVLPQKVAATARIVTHLEDLHSCANRCVGDLLAHADGWTHHRRVTAPLPGQRADAQRTSHTFPASVRHSQALLASVGGGHEFDNGRQVAAWIGLVPGQYSSGGKQRLGRITKAGDRYLRSLLVLGARAILAGLGNKQDRFSRWARSLAERRGYWRAVVAIAAKNARLAWAVLKYGEDFRLQAGTA